MSETEKAFKALYHQVFDENGDARVCGRDKCKKLILLAQKLDKDTDYGNPETGIMQVAAMKKLYSYFTL